MLRIAVLSVSVSLSCFSVFADPVVNFPITPAQEGYISVIQKNGSDCHNGNCIDPGYGIAPSNFASATQLNDAIAGFNSRAFQAAAVGAAMQDAIPNPGDRFAVRLGAVGLGNNLAGGFGASFNFNDNARVSINVGQSRNITAVSGGLNLSFK